MDGPNRLVIDAVPQQLPLSIVEKKSSKVDIENLLSDFRKEDYKSALFLLMDFIDGSKNFLSLAKRDESELKNYFIKLYYERLNDNLLVELFGTLKLYKKLRMLGTCSHVFESNEKKFNGIHGYWKLLYSLCEEITDDELEILKQSVESDFKGQIFSAEDWFCWCLQNNLFSKTNLLKLRTIFSNLPKCINVINSYKDFGLYDVRVPTPESDCGLAVIFNYEKFEKNSESSKIELQNRDNSSKDVASLKHLWTTFGFKVHVHQNLTELQTHDQMKYYASINYHNYDVFVCCLLSHGDSNAVYSVDRKLMKIADLQAPIVKCYTLNQKPKLFFIQACQGPNIHDRIGRCIRRSTDITHTDITQHNSSPPPVLCDTLTVTSSIDGYVSFGDNEGSWFMQTLCKQMMEDGENSSIEEVMTEVSERVRHKYSANLESYCHLSDPISAIQIVTRSSTLDKKLLLKKRTN